jgi:tRNA U38,U39,U40 pseudouridine synthase TruA
LFSLIPALGGFDAKNAASHREYDYYMPTFMLSNDLEIKYEVPEEQPQQHIDPDNKR